MQDKDIDGVIAHLKSRVDHWCLTDLPLPRAASAELIRDKLLAAGIKPSETSDAETTIRTFESPARAFADARKRAGENDRIAVFGSFFTVAGVMQARESEGLS
jgi:dihydrofolate synthase/folylpolyglutamate synthase